MAGNWCCEDRLLADCAKEAFSSLDNVFQLDGDAVTGSVICTVTRVFLDNKFYYVKCYSQAGERLSKYIGKSKACREWENLQRFREWGLPVPPLVAYGEEIILGVSRRGVVITEEFPNSIDLASLVEQDAAAFSDEKWLRQVSQQVAQATRVMHDHNFGHNDWKWRNILVANDESSPSINLIDCPSGMFWRGPFFEYRRVKDLACLDKVAKQVLSRTQRLRFYCDYQKIQKLSAADKRCVRKVLAFFKGRE